MIWGFRGVSVAVDKHQTTDNNTDRDDDAHSLSKYELQQSKAKCDKRCEKTEHDEH